MKHWTEQEIKKLRENYFYYLEHKEEAEDYFRRKWYLISLKSSNLGITSMKINKKCSQFLGCNVAEKVLSHVFIDVKRMPYRNKGFDFICNRGHKIDSKSSCLHENRYIFVIKHNKIADYFLCIGFDNRENLNPKHIWLIKNDEIINKNSELKNLYSLSITNTEYGLFKFSKYELTDKLKETIECCSTLKSINKSKEEVTL